MKSPLKTSFLFSLLTLALILPASAQIAFRVDTLTADQVTLTVFGGADHAIVDGTPTETALNRNFLDFAPGPGVNWILVSQNSVSGSFTGTALTNLGHTFDTFPSLLSNGDALSIYANGDLAPGEYFTSDFQVTFTGTGAFDVSAFNTETMKVYWASDEDGQTASGAFQSAGLPAVESAVPEPSTYAALAGLATLGLAMWRRRSVTAVATA